MKNKKSQLISLLVLLGIVFLFFLIILNNQNVSKNKLSKTKGLIVEACDGYGIDDYGFSVQRLINMDKDILHNDMLSSVYNVKVEKNNSPMIKLLFNKIKNKIGKEKSIIAFWTGTNWQELKTYDNGKYLIAETGNTGYFTLLKHRQPVILFVHGLGGDHTSWDELVDSLCVSSLFSYRGNYKLYASNKENLIFDPYSKVKIDNETTFIYTLDFSDNQSLSYNEQGKEIKLVVDEILQNSGSRKIILIGHSMGGLACRAYINNFGTKNIGGYVSVTSPHMGSFLALLKKSQDNILISAVNFIYSDIDINSNAISYLEPGNPELTSLNSMDFPEYLPVGTLTSVWKNKQLKKFSGFVIDYLEKKNQEILSPSQLDEYSKALRNDLTDGVVTYPSQCIEKAVPNGRNLNPIQLKTDCFHNDSNKDTECMKVIIDSILTIYNVKPYHITAQNN